MKKEILKRINLSIAAGLLLFSSCATHSQKSEMEVFVDSLMSEMTLSEKIGQLNLPASGEIVTGQAKSSNVAERIRKGQVGGLLNLKGVKRIRDIQQLAVENSRLGIPLIFGMDVIHGYETIFPIPLGLSCTWNMDAIEKSARIAAVEASADGICWTFSPMVDVSRDARWGRIAESNGEDPFLGSEIARAMVRGYQGKDMKNKDEIMSCIKHFALYGGAEAGRDYNSVDMSRQRMFNDYMPPYKAGVEAGAGSMMASFNDVDGVPATGNKWLMTDVLRKDWKFDGFVVSDYTGVTEMEAHGMGDIPTVAALAVNAGVDMDMVSDSYMGTLEQSVKEGKVSEETINTACRRILEAKYKLGLFQDPYKYCDLSRPAKQVFCQEHRDIARKIASESFVLLKNENNVLPLKKEGTVAVIGPLANTKANMPGTWSVAAVSENIPTLVEGMKSVLKDQVNIVTAKGCNLMSDAAYEERATMFGRSLNRDNRTDEEMLNEALAVAAQADVIVAAVGESSEMSGECSSRTELEIPDTQKALLKALLQTGKPVVLTLFTGRPLILNWEKENIPAILNVWFGGSEAGAAIADVLFGDVNPSGKLTTTFPQAVGQLPLFYAQKNTGRPLGEGKWFEKFRSNYIDVSNDPLYPFGYGLSYTSYQYSDVTLSSQQMTADGEITATVKVTNTGERDGYETVQMYIRDLVASVTRPVKELKGFQKVFLKAGETKEVQFKINVDLLKFYNFDIEYVYELGDFEVMIGANSRDLKSNKFTLK